MMEMEAKEELEMMNVPENDAPDSNRENASMPNGVSEELEQAAQTVDYSHFSKQEFVDLLKDLTHQGDIRKSDAVLKEAKSHMDEIQERERAEALKKFTEDGGSPDDFEYRGDTLDAAFEASFKLLKDRKAEHFKNLEDQKNENLRKKNALLEDLRKLMDGEDDRHSFDKLKEIQQQWKVIGAVPMAQVKPLWASYHALMDRFYDNRNIYFELKELDRKKNLEAKIELCARAEKLASVEKIGEAVRELNELHEEYKHIGPIAREEKDAVWERFKNASDAVYARRDAFVSNLHQEWLKNLELKELIISEVTAVVPFTSDRIKEWNQKTAEVITLQKKWEAIGAVPRAKAKDTNKRFWSAFKTFFSNKGIFFKKLDESRAQNLALKKELIQKAESLKESQDWDKAASELKQLQIKWKEIGPVPEKLREKIFQEFKAACDFFFDSRRVKFEAADKEQADNLAKKEALLAELERVTAEKSGTIAQLKEIQKAFQAIGFVPRDHVNAIKSKFSALSDKFVASIQMSADDKDKAMLEMQLENLKTDPDAAYKIQTREQTLRKKITKAENDLATLKNNLEFFARSKNADSVRAEFQVKIDAQAAELAQLKSQLKLLRSAL